ncbi:hypothetical protein ACJRO7_010917 [Eucalyptus globulus]|uniref:Flap endonuclease 1 n=1 Tax=Eucalyptus globulus TaxID=34317 RepID=A0ABD3LDH4_EUCGL
MGIKGLTKLLADDAPKAMKEQKLESYFGRRIAVDASMSICQLLVVVGRKGTQMLTNEAGEVTSHLQGMLYRTIRLLEAGIEPVYVFDGRPPDLKKQELAKRGQMPLEELAVAIVSQNKVDKEKFSKTTVKGGLVTQQHNEDCKRLLRLIGVPVVEAPSEAERERAALCKAGKVYAVASKDMDSLTFGALIFLCHLMDPSSRKVPFIHCDCLNFFLTFLTILEEMHLDMDQSIDLCILSGCDYRESIRGIGGLTALKLIHQHGSIESRGASYALILYQIPDNWPYSEARVLFKEPIVSMEEKPEIKWTTPNEEGLISFLVNENGFNIDRVIKAIEKIKAAKHELESFFKPAKNLSVPAKRKGSKCTLQFSNLAFKPKTVSTQVSVNSQPRFLGSFKMPTMVLGLRNFKQPLRVVCFLTWI